MIPRLTVITGIVSCALVLGLFLETAPAQNRAPVKKTSSVRARTYTPGDIHLEKSRVFIHVGKTGLGHEHGVEGKIAAGKVHLQKEGGGHRIEFDMKSFDADTDIARKYVGLEGSTDASTRDQVNNNMLGKDVLDVNKYPTSVFEIEGIRKLPNTSKTDPQNYELSGQFTLHGKTLPIKVKATAEEKGQWTHLRGEFSILQSDYGIKPFSKAFGAIGVADKLTIWGDFWIAGTSRTSTP